MENITGVLAAYMANARFEHLPEHVVQHTKFRVLDTLAAMISGSRLKAGVEAIRYARAQGGTQESSIVATDLMTSASNAALVNGMFAHADETDDFEPTTKAHPGSHVVPAALAMAQRKNSSGSDMIVAVALGYDLCCRFLLALGPDLVRGSHRSAEGTSSTMGAVGAAAYLAKLDEAGMRYALSYASQQVSGIWSWVRDADHVEKAFDFAGMGARNGVTAAIMAELGFTGVWDVLDGEHNALIALSSNPVPSEMIKQLGERYLVTETSIKPFSVGYPIQAPLSAFLDLLRTHRLTPDMVESIKVRLPADGARIVNNRAMPDVNCQYVIAVALIDGAVTFESSHSHDRMKDPLVKQIMGKIELLADPALMIPEAPRSGHVEIFLKDGRSVNQFVRHAPGTKENPMDAAQVNEKAASLIGPILGPSRTETLITLIGSLEKMKSVQELRELLQG
ncbi:MmgE/PrpD family protein [Candidimonas nitroreducens]|nr:MmgE/PrpD family protein [Candidimonas nitroreducens]